MSTHRRRSNAFVAAAGLALACANVAPPGTDSTPPGRLPQGVRPLHYGLELTIDPDRERFSGTARIDIELAEPTETILLHGERLSVHEVAVTPSGAATRTGRWEDTGETGVGTIRLPRAVGPGKAELRITFDAAFGQNGRGIYRVDSGGDAYAFTHFEPLSARRAFPGFDEPRFKTTFDVTLVIPAEQVAVGNTPVVEKSPHGDGKKRIRFATTKPLPTYLIAWAVGPLDIAPAAPLPAHASRARPVPLRGVSVRGRGTDLADALARTRPLVEHLEDYLRSPYPFAKLDVVAVPRFGPGAMENPGILFVRDEFLFLARPDATEEHQRNFDYVMAHELVHQWFGNLVTMPWWDDTWLNEGIATWLGRRAEEQVFPENQADDAFQAAVDHAMAQDALADARSIRRPVETHQDIYNAFDAFAYDKGGGVVAMFEHWLGPERFRTDLAHYLSAHHMRTATVSDFFAALSTGGGRDVADPFQTFLSQPGVPLIEAERACDESGGGVRVRQSRYLPLGSTISPNARWQIPICIRHGADGMTDETCELLTEESTRIHTGDDCPAWFMPNAGGVGYYRFALAGDDWRNLRRHGWVHLSERERVSVANNTEVSFRAGEMTAETAFTGLEALAADPNRQVSTAPMALLTLARETLVPAEDRLAVERFGAALYARNLARVGWDATPGESGDTKLSRRALIRFLALRARDPEVRKEARRRGRLFAGLAGQPRDPSVLESELVETVLAVVVQEGNAVEFDSLVALFRETEDDGMRRDLLRALASTQDPALARRARALSLDPALHPREVWTPLYHQTHAAETRDAAWRFAEEHFDELVERAGSERSGWMPWLAAGFCDTNRAAEVEEFLAPRVGGVEGGTRNLAASLESIRLCAALVAEQGPTTAGFFRAQP